MLCSFNFFIAVLPDCVDFHIWSLWSTCLFSKWIGYHQTWSAKWSFWLSKLVKLQVRHNFECSCCVVGWVSGTKQPRRLICPSSWFLRGLAPLPALMHCSITKIPSVSEGRGGEEAACTAAHKHPLSAEYIGHSSTEYITWPRGKRSGSHSWVTQNK